MDLTNGDNAVIIQIEQIIQIIQICKKGGGKMPKGFTGKRDVYIEVAERYEKYIKMGVLRDGDKLPSVRVAANDLGVNPNTVQRAYTLLEEKGLICSLPKKGAFVTFVHNEERQDGRRAEIIGLLNELKEKGITRDEIAELLTEVYDDRD